MNRTVFLVDGFNLYHSVKTASRDAQSKTTKWLNLKSLCSSYPPIIAAVAGERADLERIYYFSAQPAHKSKDVIDRHALYMKCLRGIGINVELARFKPKDIFCTKCLSLFVRHEERETDVAIASKLFEACYSNEADSTVLMMGDTDLAPAFLTCKRLFPNKLIFLHFHINEPILSLQISLPGLSQLNFDHIYVINSTNNGTNGI